MGKTASVGLSLHDFGHLLANGADLGRAGVCRLLDLVRTPLGEGNAEQANEVLVGGLHGHIGLDEGLPLSHQGPQLVGGEVQSVEICQAVLALDLIHTKFDLSECMVLVVLQVCEGHFEDTALQIVIGISETAGPVDDSLSDTLKATC